VIYHNPACGTSRNALALICQLGIEPHVIEYLKTPPSRAMILGLVARMGVPLHSLLREKGTPFVELGLSDPALTNDQLLNAIEAHPVLLNRPIVVSPLGVKLCRPSEAVLDLLPPEGLKPFTKEDGEVVIDAEGRRVR
ncbi:MAG TPA: arsenate reductase (glutaredoxin), partial [Brevundimonas diminuta]|nr:arsenate reductase (glutaredoxin) [Brevundimonas diminuta]